MRRALWTGALFAGAFALAVFSSCGPIEEEGGGGTLTPGKVCYSDLDCVPNDCCGEGDAAVHIEDAPDCRGIRCDGSCPTDMVDCGCAIPVCRNSRCAIAVRETCL